MKYVKTICFSISLNGELAGLFPAIKGLRQGDPFSPVLFVMAMEILSGLMREHMAKLGFDYQRRCCKTGLMHFCFVDDILIFA